MRRVAVHFWPVFCVISRATSVRKRLSVSLPRLHARPEDGRVERVGLDVQVHVLPRRASFMARSARRGLRGAGEGEHVLAAQVAEQQIARRAGDEGEARPRAARPTRPTARRCGRRPARWTSRAWRPPACRRASATAAFSAMPQAGKLKALTCTATPWRGTCTCWPKSFAPRPRATPSPSTSSFALAELRAQLRVVVERHRRAVDVELGVAAGVAAVLHRQRDELLAGVVDALGERGRASRRAGRRSSRAATGPPFSRAKASGLGEVEALACCTRRPSPAWRGSPAWSTGAVPAIQDPER